MMQGQDGQNPLRGELVYIYIYIYIDCIQTVNHMLVTKWKKGDRKQA
jgi:hypothetical protein